MNQFKGCLLASDFDGTLTDDRGNIPESNRTAIRYFIENGGIFTISTGRSAQGFHAYDSFLMNAPVLVSNGAMAYDYGAQKTMFSIGVEQEDILLLQKTAEAFEHICIELYNEQAQTFVYRPNERSYRHLSGQNITAVEIDSLYEAVFPVVKIMLCVGDEHCEEVQRFLSVSNMGKMKYIPTYGDFIEIHHKEAGKDKGVLRLAQLLHIDEKKVYCVGDGSNDVSMLKNCAIGFAPEDADSFAKSSADRIVQDRNKGAVAGVIAYLDNLF